MTKIYTKTGDQGSTSTLQGRISKSDLLAEVLGTIDELNSAVGMSRHLYSFDTDLKNIQDNLLTIGSILAGSGLNFSVTETKKLEKLIDKLTAQMPKINNFIYPVGLLHLARSICRRAERKVVELGASKNILQYLNRLSDALFTLARFANISSGQTEESWKV